MIAIVDYGLGNLRSIQNMLERAGIDSAITGDPREIRAASKLILPGVGHFRFAMDSLRERGLIDVLNERVIEARTAVLGICLGAQLMGRRSDEGDCPGLGWAAMETVRFDASRMRGGEKVPHMGWAETSHGASPLFQGFTAASRFYYVHSYHFRCDDPGLVMCTAEHGYTFASGIARGNIFGVQFHPEKSHVYGQQLLRNFAALEVR